MVKHLEPVCPKCKKRYPDFGYFPYNSLLCKPCYTEYLEGTLRIEWDSAYPNNSTIIMRPAPKEPRDGDCRMIDP